MAIQGNTNRQTSPIVKGITTDSRSHMLQVQVPEDVLVTVVPEQHHLLPLDLADPLAHQLHYIRKRSKESEKNEEHLLLAGGEPVGVDVRGLEERKEQLAGRHIVAVRRQHEQRHLELLQHLHGLSARMIWYDMARYRA